MASASSSSSSSIDSSKTIYLIVHGQRHLIDQVKYKLTSKGFKTEKMQMASLDHAGNTGEYVAMIWPPTNSKDIVISEVTDDLEDGASGMGAWATVGQKELFRISLQ
jgi:hypothetical protein